MAKYIKTTGIGKYLEDFGKINPELNNQIYYSSVKINLKARRHLEYYNWNVPSKDHRTFDHPKWKHQKYTRHNQQNWFIVVHYENIWRFGFREFTLHWDPKIEDCQTLWIHQKSLYNPDSLWMLVDVKKRKSKIN